MAEIKIEHANISLTSTWYVTEDMYENMEISSGPTTASKSVTFEYALPAGTTVKSAKVHSRWSSPSSGFYFRNVNGVAPDSDGMVAVEIDPAETSVKVTFSFRARGSTSSTGSHSGTTTVSEIYLLIETEGGYIYLGEGGKLVPYQLCRGEDGKLVPYQLHHAEGGKLAPY